MSKIIVMGGCGAVGSISVKTLLKSTEFSEIVKVKFDKQMAIQKSRRF